jgi:hypothetical protein
MQTSKSLAFCIALHLSNGLRDINWVGVDWENRMVIPVMRILLDYDTLAVRRRLCLSLASTSGRRLSSVSGERKRFKQQSFEGGNLELDDALVVPEKHEDGTQATTSQPADDVEARPRNFATRWCNCDIATIRSSGHPTPKAQTPPRNHVTSPEF